MGDPVRFESATGHVALELPRAAGGVSGACVWLNGPFPGGVFVPEAELRWLSMVAIPAVLAALEADRG